MQNRSVAIAIAEVHMLCHNAPFPTRQNQIQFQASGYQCHGCESKIGQVSDPEAAYALSQKCYKLVSLTELINSNEINPMELHIRLGAKDDGLAYGTYVKKC
jgi:hypothetical protein